MPRPPSHAIHEHIVPWRNEEWPIPWERVFGRAAPLALEIGFGGGEFLEEQAARRPERNHVGVELSWTSTTHLLRRLERTGLPHVKVLLAEAEVAVGQLFAPRTLAEVFINHPCPWPKARHGARRLIRPDFVALLADRMETGARLTLVTDHADYAAWSAEVLEGQEALVSCHPTTEVASLPDRAPTRYQAKAMAQDIPIHFFQWRKVRAPRSLRPLPSSDRLDAMPSLTLRPAPGTSGETRPLLGGFAPWTERGRHAGIETTVRFVTSYAEQGGDSWLIETLVVEDRLHQEFGIQVFRRRDGSVGVKLARLARPHPTAGVKRAVWLVGRWLLAHHPELRLEHENVGRDIAGEHAPDENR